MKNVKFERFLDQKSVIVVFILGQKNVILRLSQGQRGLIWNGM